MERCGFPILFVRRRCWTHTGAIRLWSHWPRPSVCARSACLLGLASSSFAVCLGRVRQGQPALLRFLRARLHGVIALRQGLDPSPRRAGDAGQQRQQHQRRRQHRAAVAAARTSAAGSPRTAGRPPPARRSGSAARRRRSRWPSRSGASRSFSSAFITIQSSSPRTSWPSLPRVGLAVGRDASCSVAPSVLSRVLGLRRLLLADDPADLVERRLAEASRGRTASCRSAARTAARPGE